MAEDAETFACKYCEREFDSKRGLHIHQTQVHPDEEKQETGHEVEESKDSSEEDDDDKDIFSDSEDIDIEKSEEEFSVEVGDQDDSTFQMSLTTRQVAAAALIVGLLIGGIIAGIYFSTTPAM